MSSSPASVQMDEVRRRSQSLLTSSGSAQDVKAEVQAMASIPLPLSEKYLHFGVEAMLRENTAVRNRQEVKFSSSELPHVPWTWQLHTFNFWNQNVEINEDRRDAGGNMKPDKTFSVLNPCANYGEETWQIDILLKCLLKLWPLGVGKTPKHKRRATQSFNTHLHTHDVTQINSFQCNIQNVFILNQGLTDVGLWHICCFFIFFNILFWWTEKKNSD